jgi:two-component system LytT family sensor kinase
MVSKKYLTGENVVFMILFTRFFERYKLHILFWGVYILFWTIFAAAQYHKPAWFTLLISLIFFLGQSTISYWGIYRLVPVYFNHKRYGVFAFLVIGGIILSTAFIMGSMNGLLLLFGDPSASWSFGEFSGILVGNFYLVFLVIALKALRDKIKNDRRNKLLEKEKTENELRFLKSQINPHFLFNAINSIYVLIKKDTELAGVTLVKFADMLRYQLYECNTDEIPIGKEIAYLDNYIGLEKLRKGQAVDIRYEVGTGRSDFYIAPFLIIPFVENAFKYVSSYPDKRNFVTIRLNYQADIFELYVENSVDEPGADRPGEKNAGGIGLENVRRRLELIYNGRHSLDIRKIKGLYSVLLTIRM